MNIVPTGFYIPVSGFDAAVAFTTAFPPPMTFKEPPKVINVHTFDQWASMKGFYPVDMQQATLVAFRNALRSKIHKAGLSQEWRDAGRVAFTLRTTVIGGWMAANLPMRTADELSLSLGERVLRLVKTKRRELKRVVDGIDMLAIDPIDADRIDNIMLEVAKAHLTMEFAIGACTREIQRCLRQFPRQYMDLIGVEQDSPIIETVDEDDDRDQESAVADEMAPEEPEINDDPPAEEPSAEEPEVEKPAKKGRGKGKKKK